MPVCEGCGASFDDVFKFCTFCGRAKPALNAKVIVVEEILKQCCKKCGASIGNNYAGLYCPKCGAYLFHKCMQCGEANWWESEYCEKCGVKLSEAKFFLSEERRNQWFQHFLEFLGYANLRNDKGMIKTKEMKRVLDSVFPEQFFIAFGIPIQSKDWCIDQISYGGQLITNGLFYVASDQIRIVDCELEKGISILHNELQGVIIEDDKSITLTLNDEKKLSIIIKFPSVGLATAVDIFGFFAGMMGAIALDTLGEMDDPKNRIGKETDKNLNNMIENHKSNAPSLADQINNYRLSIYNLFKEIVDTIADRTM